MGSPSCARFLDDRRDRPLWESGARMTPDDLALLLGLGMVEPSGPGEYRLTGLGRILAGERAAKPAPWRTVRYVDSEVKPMAKL